MVLALEVAAVTITETGHYGPAADLAGRFGLPPSRRYRSPAAVSAALDTTWRSTKALDAVDEALVKLVDTPEHDGLMVFMPSQEGKSEKCSRRFPEWCLDWRQDLRVACVSYELDLAVRWGRAVKQDIAGAGGKLKIDIRRDSYAAGRWDTLAGGGMYCVGVGGPLTGRPIDIGILDDPVKDRAAAESERIRAITWEWWESVYLPRLAPGAKTVLVMTRWHTDDLAGRILARPGPLKWRVLTIPAIALPGDEIGREPGAELPSVRGREPGYFRHRQATMSRYVFSAMYQQGPTAAEGNLFRRAAFRYWRPMEPWQDGRERLECEGVPVTLADCWRFATMDVAASTKTEADWTVVCAWAVTPAGDLILLDRQRRHVPDSDHYTMARPLMDRWGMTQVWVEANWWSKTFTQDAIAAGLSVSPLEADKDKLTRAIPAAGRVHAGKVWFPAETSGCLCGECDRGVWLDEWTDELAGFDKGLHDDQVDCLAYAARVVSGQWVPPSGHDRPRRDPVAAQIQEAYDSATGNGHGEGGLDIMGAQW